MLFRSDFPIAGNDDAIKSIRLLTSAVATAVISASASQQKMGEGNGGKADAGAVIEEAWSTKDAEE